MQPNVEQSEGFGGVDAPSNDTAFAVEEKPVVAVATPASDPDASASKTISDLTKMCGPKTHISPSDEVASSDMCMPSYFDVP